jgi:predicted amino acid-binding ACT domain protein
MELIVETLESWRADVDARSVSLADKLDALKLAGADLELILAPFNTGVPGSGNVLVAPLYTASQNAAASEAGFDLEHRLRLIRIVGPDRPGIAAVLIRRLADHGVKLHGFWAATVGPRFTACIAVDTLEDVARALHTLSQF